MQGSGGAIEKLTLEVDLPLEDLLDQLRLVLQRPREVARHSSRGRRKRTPNLPERLLRGLQEVGWIVASLFSALASRARAAPPFLLYSLGHDDKPTVWRRFATTREVSAIELVEAAAARLAAVNPALNAVIHPSVDRGRDTAVGRLSEGPYRGVPFTDQGLDCARGERAVS